MPCDNGTAQRHRKYHSCTDWPASSLGCRVNFLDQVVGRNGCIHILDCRLEGGERQISCYQCSDISAVTKSSRINNDWCMSATELLNHLANSFLGLGNDR